MNNNVYIPKIISIKMTMTTIKVVKRIMMVKKVTTTRSVRITAGLVVTLVDGV